MKFSLCAIFIFCLVACTGLGSQNIESVETSEDRALVAVIKVYDNESVDIRLIDKDKKRELIKVERGYAPQGYMTYKSLDSNVSLSKDTNTTAVFLGVEHSPSIIIDFSVRPEAKCSSTNDTNDGDTGTYDTCHGTFGSATLKLIDQVQTDQGWEERTIRNDQTGGPWRCDVDNKKDNRAWAFKELCDGKCGDGISCTNFIWD